MTAIHAFVQANAPFFTWTGAVFYASVAVGLVLWAVSELWAAFWKWLDPYDLALLHSTTTAGKVLNPCPDCGEELAVLVCMDENLIFSNKLICPHCGATD